MNKPDCLYIFRCTELQRSEVVCKFLCEFNDDKLFQGENFGDHAGRVLLALPKSILTDRWVLVGLTVRTGTR